MSHGITSHELAQRWLSFFVEYLGYFKKPLRHGLNTSVNKSNALAGISTSEPLSVDLNYRIVKILSEMKGFVTRQRGRLYSPCAMRSRQGRDWAAAAFAWWPLPTSFFSPAQVSSSSLPPASFSPSLEPRQAAAGARAAWPPLSRAR